MTNPSPLDIAQSLAQLENLGSLLLHTKPSRRDVVRWILLSVLCLSPGFFMWVALATADGDGQSGETGFEWIILLFLAMSVAGASVFIAYALRKNKHHILLYERGLVELRNNKSQGAMYKDLKVIRKGVRVTAYNVATLAHAVDYILVFPDGRQSTIDWCHDRRPVGAIIQSLIAQHKYTDVSS